MWNDQCPQGEAPTFKLFLSSRGFKIMHQWFSSWQKCVVWTAFPVPRSTKQSAILAPSPLLSFRLDPFLPPAFVSPSYVPFCPGVSCNPGPILPLCLPSDFFVRSSRFQSRRVRHHLFCALCSLFIHLLQVVHHPVVSIRTEFKPGNASLATLY